jgi:hypothetical protein
MTKLTYLTFGAILAALAIPARANLIANGDFATNIAGWTTGGGGCVGNPTWDAGGNPTGSVLLNGCGESSVDPFASQILAGLTIGATYTVNWDMQLHSNVAGGGTGKSFGVFLDTEAGTPLALAEFLDTAWHNQQISFVATSTSHTIFFAGELDARTPGGPGLTTDVSYRLDNVAVNAAVAGVPEPSALVLSALGLAGLFIRRRLRS